MVRAKRKQMPQAATALRVDREAPLDDRAVEAILHAVYGAHEDDDEGNPSVGIGYAVIAGMALWTIIGGVVVLLI